MTPLDSPIRISNSVLVGLAFGATWFETALARLLTMRVRPCAACDDLILRSRHRVRAERGPMTGSAASRRMDHDKIVDTTSRSRDAWRPSFSINSPSSRTEGAGKTGCPSHPWSACNKKARGRTTGTSRTTGLPCTMVLRLIRDLPGDQALLSPSPTDRSIDLTPALGRQDHTISPSASCCSSDNTPRPSHPASNVRDDREAPLLWRRDARMIVVICPTAQGKMCTTGSLRMAGMHSRDSLHVIASARDLSAEAQTA
jgi:hypothetical protein